MKIIQLTLILFFAPVILFAQTDEHVLLNLALDSVFSGIKDNEPGGSIFIQKGNQILYSKSFGLANLKTKEKFDETTISNTASIAKTFIAYSILILQKSGKLSLEDSIIKFFPGEISKQTDNITIKHLLTHTSGLPDVPASEKDLLKKIDKPEFEPGSNYKYSEVSYKILAMIIEKISGIKWQIFVKKNIFEPSGMINTILPDLYPEQKVALSYKKEKKRYKLFRVKKQNVKHHDLLTVWSSVGELRKYIYAINECVFVDCESLKQYETLWSPANWRGSVPPPHGFAWFVSEEKDKDLKINYESAFNGFKTSIAMYPDEKIIIIILSNNNTSYFENVVNRLINLSYIK